MQSVNCISLEIFRVCIRSERVVRVVKQWFTSRTVGELHIIRETSGVSRSRIRTTRTGVARGGETVGYESYSW